MRNVKEVPNAPFLGFRQRKVYKDKINISGNEQELEDKYTWWSYKDVFYKACALGHEMLKYQVAPQKNDWKDYKLKLVAIYSKNTKEYIVFDTACSLFNYCSVPIYDTFGEEATEFIFKQTEIETCFLSLSHLKGMADLILSGKGSMLKNLVIMDDWDISDGHKEIIVSLKAKECSVFLMSKWMEGGDQKDPVEDELPRTEDLYMISYTSGTTGEPKGAMISHTNLIITAQHNRFNFYMDKVKPVHLSYLPLPHIMERVTFVSVCNYKGQYGIYNGDVLKLKEDLAILKPTFFISVPRLYNKFYDKIKMQINQLKGTKKKIIERAVRIKLEAYDKSGTLTDWLYDKLVFKKMRTILGGNVRVMISGSAPISIEVTRFLQVCFSVKIEEGFGMTEISGIGSVPHNNDHSIGNVGGICDPLEFKLIDVPEMNYTCKDEDEAGRPTPRGEMLFRGQVVILGYYKNQEKTDEAIDHEGWFYSGDIGMLLPETRALKIIDRKKSIFKLSQGEYVAPDRLEQIYKVAMCIEEIFVYGDSLKSCLVAIVVVNPEGLKAYSQDESMDLSVFE